MSLYSDDTLGVTGYVETRRSVQDRYGDKKDVFRNKMTEFVKDGPTNMIFTEDLKTMVYLSEGEKDFELLHNMMVK